MDNRFQGIGGNNVHNCCLSPCKKPFSRKYGHYKDRKYTSMVLGYWFLFGLGWRGIWNRCQQFGHSVQLIHFQIYPIMQASMTKSLIVTLIWAATAPAFFSIMVSMAAFMYFMSMLYYNVVLKHHNGSWKAYFRAITCSIAKSTKSIFRRFKQR